MSSRSVPVDLDSLLCPICVEIPDKKVYQCDVGHIICHRCITICRLCPQCKVRFAANPARNRALENILDTVEKKCKYAAQGCQQVAKKVNIEAHHKICLFRPVKLCANLGCNTCSIAISSGDELQHHILVEHKMELKFYDEMVLKLLNFPNWIAALTTMAKTQRNPTLLAYVWGKEQGPFLTNLKVSFDANGDATFSCVTLYLGSEPKNAEHYKIHSMIYGEHEDEENYACKWTDTPIHFKTAEDASLIPNYTVPVKYLLHRLGTPDNSNFDLVLHCYAQQF